jgi:hypothetical protein
MIWGFIRSFLLALLGLPVSILGLVVVWFALPYRRAVGEAKPFTQYPELGNWQLVRLPSWALWWDNAYDGVYGDKRGWWANYCIPQYGSTFDSRKCMWYWAALRNPANYFSRNVCGIDVSTIHVEKVAGNIHDESVAPYRGFFVLKGKDQNGKIYPRFYAEYAIYKTYGLMIDIGWKIKLSHNGTAPDAPEKDRIKGSVFTLSFAKELS